MKEFKINNKGSAQLFTNSFLERLSRTCFAIPVVFYFLVSTFFLVYAGLNYNFKIAEYFLLFTGGCFLFTLIEYFVHRYIFHFAAKTEQQEKFQYNIHGVHHEFPKDKSRLVMPPVISVFISAMFLFIFRLLLGPGGYILFAGFIAGYCIYLLIHYAVHTLKPPTHFFRYLWRHQSLHHYNSADAAFSVSFPFWDFLFGTMPKHGSGNANKLPDGNRIS